MVLFTIHSAIGLAGDAIRRNDGQVTEEFLNEPDRLLRMAKA
jgi:hypothetical protein